MHSHHRSVYSEQEQSVYNGHSSPPATTRRRCISACDCVAAKLGPGRVHRAKSGMKLGCRDRAAAEVGRGGGIPGPLSAGLWKLSFALIKCR
jgi:hypothetical protein